MHLDGSHPEASEQFVQFLKQRAPRAKALYILGDLFEYWIGDDDPDPDKKAIVQALGETNVPTYVMHGNRDFLLGKRFAESTGATMLSDPTLITIGTQTILLSHGDLLCTDDHQYQKYRARMNKPWMRFVVLASPLWFRRWLANRGRRRSKEVSAGKAAFLMDVNQETVAQTMQDHGVDLMVHGHTHRPNIHHFDGPNGTMTRIVLGDWYTQGSVLTFDENGKYELEVLPRD